MSKDTLPANTSGDEIIKERFQQEKDICSLYVDCAKTYVQISTGALLLSITFYDEIIGIEKALLKNNPFLIATWFLWLFTIVSGVTYQYCVIKYLEDIANHYKLLEFQRTWKWYFLKIFREEPYRLYGAMIVAFYAALLIFFILALIAIF